MAQRQPLARTYPTGVPSWIDLEAPDVDAACAFYGELLGWSYEERTPPGSSDRFVLATIDGLDVASISGPAAVGPDRSGATWSTFVAVDDADAVVAQVEAAGGRVDVAPVDAGPAGRAAVVTDPQGARLHLWQAGARLGAQLTSELGAWVFSNLRTTDLAGAQEFYGRVLPWRFVDQGWAVTVQVPGYGDHLASTTDPDIRTRQAGAPEDFADVAAALVPLEGVTSDLGPHWYVVLAVADRDAAADAVLRLGGEVLDRQDEEWSRIAVVRDPQGAVLTLSQFAPPA